MSEEEFFNRAINRICKDYDYDFATEFKNLYLKKNKEIERLNNIIKEVKECINYYAIEDEDYSKTYNTEEKALLEILDKGSDKE